jgi:hypothetical protein
MRIRPKTRGRFVGRVGVLALCLSASSASTALAVAPTIVKTTVSKVSTEAATLGALINPQGQPGTFHFEYGPKDCSKSVCTALPGGTFEAGTSAVAVETPLVGLTPGTTYHLRVVAENAEGVKGPDRVFATYVLPFEGLPDDRAYEQASPVKKNAADARGMVEWAKAADDGNAVSFLSSSGLPGGEGGQDVPSYVASRGATDWSTQALLPPATLGSRGSVRGWLPDLSTVFEEAAFPETGEDQLFLARSSADGSLSEILGHGAGLGHLDYAGASSDGSKIVFESFEKLSCCAEALAGKPNLYLWDRDTGEVSLVGVLNAATPEPPVAGAVAGPYDWMRSPILPLSASGGGSNANYYTQDMHAISADGDAIYFTALGNGALYVRINPTAEQSPLNGESQCTNPELACTLEVSAFRRSIPDPLGRRPAAFMAASADGKAAFFASPEKLTEDANTGPVQPPPAIQTAPASSGTPVKESPGVIALGLGKDSEHLYWVNPAENAIGRSGLKGENPEPNFISIPPLKVKNAEEEIEEVPAKPQYLAVDSEYVYWSSEGKGKKLEGTIGRADIKGTPESVEGEWIIGITRPKGIAVDSEYVYWAKEGAGFTGEGSIERAKRSDGKEVIPSFVNGIGGTERPEGVAVDAGHIYWTMNDSNGNFGEVLRAELEDGSNLKFKGIGKGVEGRGIAVDSEYVYWASQGKEAIGRMLIADFTQAGTCDPLNPPVVPGCEPTFIPTAGKPKGLTTDGTDLWWSVNGETSPNPGNDLYRYRREGEVLEDVTGGGPNPNGAEVKGVLGASADGKRVYFAANGDLDGGGDAQAGNCSGSFFAFVGKCSLYLAEEMAPGEWNTTFIAPLDASGDCDLSDAADWLGKGGTLSSSCRPKRTALVSANGGVLLFRSQEQLSEYDNEGNAELYRYEAGADELGCVSCNPTGESPAGPVRLGSIGLTAFEPARPPAFVLSRNLSADGKRAFFETPDPLVIDDTNGKAGCGLEGSTFFPLPSCQDVYEWEAEGTGSCKEDVQGGGCLYLLSTGTSPNSSFFADASLNGDDAFIATRSAGLVRQDQDKLQDVYDTRVGGGLISQDKSPEPECESLDGCHGPQSPQPAPGSPVTANNAGPGNVKHPRKPTKKKHKHKKHRKHKRGADGKGSSR